MHQQGGNGTEALVRWLLAANTKRETLLQSGAYTPPWNFTELRDTTTDLRLIPGPTGPILSRFEPSSLGDIITNIVATFEAPVPNGQILNRVMAKLKTEDPEVYRLLQRLETVLREEAQQVGGGTLTATAEPDLTAPPADNRPYFLWIAIANLVAEQPERPVLLKELPPAPVAPAPAPSPTQRPVAPFPLI